MPNIDSVWARIKSHEGSGFRTKTDLPFTYTVSGAALSTSRTDHNLPKSEFAKALQLVPIGGPGEISELVRGSAYIWAILHDHRIRLDEW